MNILGITRSVTNVVVAAGVGTVVRNAIAHTTPIELTKYNKLMVKIGTAVVGGMVGEMAAAHVVQKFDDIVEKVQAQVEENGPALEAAAGSLDVAGQALKEAAEHTGEAFFKAKGAE